MPELRVSGSVGLNTSQKTEKVRIGVFNIEKKGYSRVKSEWECWVEYKSKD